MADQAGYRQVGRLMIGRQLAEQKAEFAEQVTSIAAACVGKHRFDTPQAAYKAIHRTTAATVRPYRCEHCGGFHLGSRKVRRKIKRV